MLQSFLGDAWKVVNVGYALLGLHFDQIVLLPNWADGMFVEEASQYKSQLRTRLRNKDATLTDMGRV